MGLPYKNTPRQSYPMELLKHQFMPYGSLVKVNNNEMDIDTHEEETVMNVDTENPEPVTHAVSPKVKKKQGKTVNEIHSETPINPSTATEMQSENKVKGKKRKVESSNTAESPAAKKPKKSKT